MKNQYQDLLNRFVEGDETDKKLFDELVEAINEGKIRKNIIMLPVELWSSRRDPTLLRKLANQAIYHHWGKNNDYSQFVLAKISEQENWRLIPTKQKNDIRRIALKESQALKKIPGAISHLDSTKIDPDWLNTFYAITWDESLKRYGKQFHIKGGTSTRVTIQKYEDRYWFSFLEENGKKESKNENVREINNRIDVLDQKLCESPYTDELLVWVSSEVRKIESLIKNSK